MKVWNIAVTISAAALLFVIGKNLVPQKDRCVANSSAIIESAAQAANTLQRFSVDSKQDGKTVAIGVNYVPYADAAALMASTSNCCAILSSRGGQYADDWISRAQNHDVRTVTLRFVAHFKDDQGRLGSTVLKRDVDVDSCGRVRPLPR
jgi:hypothetical protein